MKNHPHVLVLLMYWYPYEGAMQPIYGPIFRELMKRGFRITIVCSFPHYRLGRKERWEAYRGKLLETDEWEGARVIRSYVFAPVFRSPRIGRIMRVLNFLSFGASCLPASCLAKKPDLIFAPSFPPLLNALSAWLIGKIKGCPFIYNIQDLYPDIAAKTGMIRSRGLITFLSRLESFIYGKAKKIQVITRGMRGNLLRKGVDPEKIEVIPNFCDLESVRPSPRENPFSIRHDLCNFFIVLFAGNMGFSHGLEQLLGAARLLRNRPEILFLFIGRGENRDSLMDLVQSWSLSNVRFLPLQPSKRMNEVWAAADISVVCLKPGVDTELIFPSKTFGIMASGRPVLAVAGKDSELAGMVEEARCGVVVEPGDPYAIKAAVLSLEGERDKRREMGDRGRRFVERNYSLRRIVDLYENIFRGSREGGACPPTVQNPGPEKEVA